MINHTKTRWIRRIVLGVVIWLVLTVLFGPFGSVSICHHCGRERHVTRFLIPLTDIPYLSFHRVNDTGFSSRLAHMVPEHKCHWLFGHGGATGFNLSCALGEGGRLLSIVRRKSIVTFIENVDRFEGRTAALNWIDKCLDPNETDSVRGWFAGVGFPEAGFETEAQYRKWKSLADAEGAHLQESR